MTVDAEKSSSFSFSRKIILSVSCVLVLLGVALSILSHELEQRLVAAVAAKLARIEGLSIQIGQASLGLTAVHIDHISMHRPGHENGPRLLLTDIHVNPSLAALLRGNVQIDQLNISRAALLSHQDLTLNDIVASIHPHKDHGFLLQFQGKTHPGTLGGTIEWSTESSLVHVRGQIQGEALRVFHPKIARSQLRDIQGHLTLAIHYDKVKDELQIDEIKLSSRGLAGIVKGHVAQVRTKPRVDLTLTIPTVPCQTLVTAPPQDFIPDLQGFKLSGNYAAEFKLALDFEKLEESQLSGYRGFPDCVVTEAPAHLSQKHLLGSFQHTTRLTAGINQTFQVGAENPNFVPITQLPEALTAAFLATEDISFFRHSGFVPESLSLAIGHNLLENRFAMGGSTITMQMVKNVFLSHEKTLSRKIQELFLTDYVERTLGKQRILEIYLNVIEFGPGIFGIGSAARHFFDKRGSELSPLEAVYLASIVYSPRRHYGAYCRCAISKDWDRRVRQLLNLMHDKGLISEADFLTSQNQSLVFRSPPLGCPNHTEARREP